jgi:hypothetical protein
MTSASAAPSDGPKAPPRSWDVQGLGVVIVVLMLVIFVAFAVWAAIGTGSKDLSGRVLILGPIETLAAATLGWYFGSAVQRERVTQAEAQALQAARDAENGRALAALVLVREGRVVENDAGSTLVDTKATGDQKLRREYADAARLLFPYSLGRTKPTDESKAHDLGD